MLNSRYAPVAALAVLGIVLVAVIGWFLAIQPQIEGAAEAATEAESIRSNTAVIEGNSARLDEYQTLLDADDTIAAAIDLNAPSRFDVEGFRTRVLAALDGTNVALISVSLEEGESVDGWELEPGILVSNQVAQLFTTGPIGVSSDTPQAAPSTAADGTVVTPPGTWTAVVTPRGGEASVTGDIRRVEVVFEIVGNATQVDRFVTAMADPEQQLFQVYEVTQTSGTTDDILEDRTGTDNDILATITGALYIHEADLSIIDEDVLEPATPQDDGFIETP
ncbi:hypothetical protein [Demequina zhanjiangensis]|uniref:Uncharacterized protein n=1 Tax=Demequina zhanjiangensis TaxID=3051659 RepID=A0ABT8G2I7_9MICO|nr:hypothetical protein [Demequina sp. SYSU T00b26]MDN4473348.1 hypothetical protein [Demequina sp. SYSU T00b26]